MVAATMAEKHDTKLDTQSVDSVAIPSNYSVTSEPPPYKFSTGKSVKIARLIAITVIAVAALLGGAIVLAAYIQTKGSQQCTTTDVRVESPAAPSSALFVAPAAENHTTPAVEEEVKAAKKQQPEKAAQTAEVKKEKEVKEEEEDEDEDEKELEKLMQLPFGIDDLAQIFLELNRKDNTNCFVEKLDLDEPSGKKPTRIVELNGASVAIICESRSSPKPLLPFPFGLGQPMMMLQSPLRMPMSRQPLLIPQQPMLRPVVRMNPQPLFNMRPPVNKPFFAAVQQLPARHLVPPARRLDTEGPFIPRNVLPPMRPPQNPRPQPPRPLPQRPVPEIRQPSAPVSPVTVPVVRGNLDQADRSPQSNLPRPRGRSLNFDSPVSPLIAEPEKLREQPQPQPRQQPGPNPIMNFLRSVIGPITNRRPGANPQAQQRSLTPSQAIPIPFQQPRPEAAARELHLQPVITLPQFLQAPLATRSHVIQPRSVN